MIDNVRKHENQIPNDINEKLEKILTNKLSNI